MFINQIFEGLRNTCKVCGQTPCNCTHVAEEKVRLDPKCWKGKKIGNPKTKMKGGVRVNNCVPAESVEEGVTEGSQQVDSLVTDALKIMRGPESTDAIQALKTVLGDREFSSRRGFYNFYIRQLVDMYGQQGVAEGSEFGAYYYEQLAQQTFDINPNLQDENEILNLGYKIAKGELGSRAQGIFRGEDFPGDFVTAYGYLKKQGVAEGAGNVGSAIKSLYKKIYRAGDDEIEYFYNDSPVFAQYWDEYEGDLNSIIAEVDPAELQIIHDELASYVDQANLAEVSDATLTSYLTKVDADSQKHEKDPTKRSAEKRNKSVAGFSRAFNKLDARKDVKEVFQNDEANLMYRYDAESGRLKQRMVSNNQEQSALRSGYGWTPEEALKKVGIIRSKFDPKTFVQKQGNKWVKVFPYGDKTVDEAQYDRGDYYSARQGGEYGKGLTASNVGSGGGYINKGANDGQKGRPKKTSGFTDKLPADPFGRTTGTIPASAKPKKELDPFREADEPGKEAKYGKEYQDTVKRAGQAVKNIEKKYGPVDIASLAKRLNDIEQGKK